ncbi:MAG: GMC family oxidoreductase [Rheinheimera sp.]|uniref:GMC family oxidoreductase n=1 Tax=Arsukibacterium sp. UBA3155 TaxID=1946058 RepID=UPI000C8C5F59|nr:GMC family oxidoreductase [Arsukibacterium sp. UBA3155]MAD76534.1 GMC family oxidoreductase [Rheinheimera sp.]|tara:strand:+ start:186898 stop:188454 length:1557 start_codon:yes stop_codon:yes gene_type:complete
MQKNHIDASQFVKDQQFETDVVIIGSGAGGGIAAEQLAQAGFKVLLLEEGAYYTRDDFVMEERWAYPNLYQEGAARKTRDQAIGILQGRTVGGSTTVNWTTSIRTPPPTLDYWQSEFGLNFTAADDLTPYFAKAEQRLNIQPWQLPPNGNNSVIKRGCEALGWEHTIISRNVNGCANLGYCGMGCPINGKQSMLVSTIPAAMALGATLVSRISVRKLNWRGESITSLDAVPVNQHFQPRSDLNITIRAKHYILAAGAIGSPAILLRSNVPDPSDRLGKHTYLHPSLISGAVFAEQINGHAGAPQSVYSDQFVWPAGNEIGYKLEAAPVHPVLMATKLTGSGEQHAALMQQFNQLQVTIALLRDGFNPQSQGGTVSLDNQQQPVLDYPITDYLWQGARRALLSMAEMQFAAGASQVLPIHHGARLYGSWREAKAAIADLPMQKYRQTVASAHVMGGCNMSADPTQGVVNPQGRHHQLQNLSIFDGSILPTSLGANPQLTIYGMTWRNCEILTKQLNQLL